MNEKLTALLAELEAFGEANDAAITDRARRMLNITPDTGEFLLLLIRAQKAKRVLEIGASDGYSTLWLAHAVEPLDGRVTTLELSPRKAEMARENFGRAGMQSRIDLRLGNAGDFLKAQARETVDFIFLDSERSEYVGWWNDLQRVLVSSGLLVVDNAVSHAREMEIFSARVRETPGYLTALVPVGKGELVILKEG
ncbi:cobalt-precorrin-6B (C15)-methyltransferase [Anaerolineae bacterium]|nr:cobalt-precorrin-6B (C15)-methyltransferase [Anaerolineae bacterium]